MIWSLNIKSWDKLPGHYIQELQGKIPENIDFKDGLNVLIGPNGSGKSTILRLIKRISLSENNIMTTPEKYEIKKLIDEFKKDPTYLLGAEITADYEKPVFNFLSEIPEGDELKNISNFIKTFNSKNLSSGEYKWDSLFDFFNKIFTEKLDKNVYKNEIIPEPIRDYYNRLHKGSNTFTILMDEPDVNLDLDKLEELLTVFTEKRDDVQFIVAIHNPALVYKIRDKANFIELEKGYLRKIIKFIES